MSQKFDIKVPESFTREAEIEIRGEGEKQTFSMSISSDVPYLRYDWWNDKEYWEVLDHGKGMVDEARLKAGLPILFNHKRDEYLGCAKAYTNDGKKITVTDIVWSSDAKAQQKKADALSGALPKTSVGYKLLDEGICIGEKDGKPIYKFKWEPFEGSLVTIPADVSVGVGRTAEELQQLRSLPHHVIAISLQKEVDENKEKEHTPENPKQMIKNLPIQFRDKDSGGAAGGTATVEEINSAREDARKTAVEGMQKRNKEILDFTKTLKERKQIDVSELANAYIIGEKAGKSFDDFRQEVLIGEFKATPVETNGDIPGVGQKEVKQFSLMKALREMANGGRLEGHEKAMCDAAAKVIKHEFKGEREFIIPAEVTRQGQMDIALERMLNFRAQQVSTFAAGGALVAQEMQGLIEFLRNTTVLGKLGITVLSGLVGDIIFPVQTGGATAYWVSETGALTDSEGTFAQKTMTPHRLGSTIPISTTILAQSSIPMENWVRNELDTVIGLKADVAGLHGTGVGGEPLGLQNTTGINATVTFGGAATWVDVVEFETGIAVDNAVIGAMKFALSTASVGKWKTILRDSVAGAAYLIQDNGLANGYGFERTNQIAGNIAFFGVWAQLLRGIWAGRSIIVDPYALKKSGQVEITVNELTDFLVRQPLAFNVSTDSAAA